MRILLASNSPRRKEILTKGKIDFTVVKSNYKEESFENYEECFIKKNSLYKALDAARSVDFPAVVIGADTMVILREGNSDVCLLKPQNYDEAFLMLKKLSDCTHKVVTSISLVKTPAKKDCACQTFAHLTDIDETFVTFRNLNDDEIQKYLETFEPFDKAGSYGIQDFLTPNFDINTAPLLKNKEDVQKNFTPNASFNVQMPATKSFIEKIEGDYFNVMGISIVKLKEMLEKFPA